MSPRPPPVWMVRLNVAFLRRGLRLGTQHLLTVPGRKRGEPRSTPVSIAIHDCSRYIVAFPDADWVQNVRATGTATLARGRSEGHVRLSELATTERGPVLWAFLEQVRGGVRFFGRQTPDEIVATAARYPVFVS